MFSNLTIGLLVGLGFGAWIYSKSMHSSGNNTKNSLILAAVAGVFAMLVVATILGIVFKGH